ncbi:hypothetical protein AB0B79_35015, partial [Streptomyces sp. NPDC039022]|uniref:hypothetical protein n=1 Tax=Streptomyces sp. NPDC039022 TaxID=3157091 RepID=UPI00340FCB6A
TPDYRALRCNDQVAAEQRMRGGTSGGSAADTDGRLREYQSFRDFSVEKAGKLGYDFHSRV